MASQTGKVEDEKTLKILVFGFALLTFLVVVLAAVNSVTRIRLFSPDSMVYVDVARNLLAGRGLVQSAMGYGMASFSPDAPIPMAFTAHPPLYPILIAMAGRVGFSLPDAALAISMLGFGLSLLAAYLLGRDLYDGTVALFGVGLLLNYYPLRYVAGFAWSETFGIFFVLLTLWLLVRARRGTQQGWLSFAAGLAAGLAFSARYPLVAIVLVPFALVQPKDLLRSALNAGLWLFGFILSALPVVVHNLSTVGMLTGATNSANNPSDRSLVTNILDALGALAGYQVEYYNQTVIPFMQAALLILSVLFAALLLVRRRELAATAKRVFLSRGAHFLTLWAVGCVLFLIIVRSVFWFDQLNARLIVPAGVGLVILWAAFVGKAFRVEGRHLVYAALALAVMAGWRKVRFLVETPPTSDAAAIARSDRLIWIQQKTSNRDLIIGDFATDVPFYLGRPVVVNYAPYPSSDYPDYAWLTAFVKNHCGDFDNIYFIVKKLYGPGEADWRNSLGPFVADIVFGRTQPYPGVYFRRELSDAYVFQIMKPSSCAR